MSALKHSMGGHREQQGSGPRMKATVNWKSSQSSQVFYNGLGYLVLFTLIDNGNVDNKTHD